MLLCAATLVVASYLSLSMQRGRSLDRPLNQANGRDLLFHDTNAYRLKPTLPWANGSPGPASLGTIPPPKVTAVTLPLWLSTGAAYVFFILPPGHALSSRAVEFDILPIDFVLPS
jgi:hypothetical protein